MIKRVITLGMMAMVLTFSGCGSSKPKGYPEEKGYPIAPDAKFRFSDFERLDADKIIEARTGKPYGRSYLNVLIADRLVEIYPMGSPVKELEQDLYKAGFRKSHETKEYIAYGQKDPKAFFETTPWYVSIRYNIDDKSKIESINVWKPSVFK